MHPGLIDEALRTLDLGVKGHVTVDICDERGRVLYRVDAPNYINTTQWQRLAKWAQKNYWWQGLVPTGGVTLRSSDGRDPRIQPRMSNDVIAAWADTTAEDNTDRFAYGEVTAYAHRWGQGSPGTRQGIVNPTLCTLSDDTCTWTWEWGTTDGNGTFQSVGWRRLYTTAIPADLAMFTRRCTSVASLATLFAGNGSRTQFTSGPAVNSSQVPSMPLVYDGSGSLYTVGSVSSVVSLVSIPVTFDGNGNYSVGAMVNQASSALGTAMMASGMGRVYGLCRLGTDWIAVGSNTAAQGTTTGRRPIIRRITNAGSTTWSNVNAGTYSVESAMIDVTFDGTNLWAIAYNGNAGTSAIHRIDPATGTISSSINSVVGGPSYLPVWNSSNPLTGIEWDSANSWFWVEDFTGGIFNIDSSGNWLGVYLHTIDQQSSVSTFTLTGFYTSTQTRWAKGDNFDAEPTGGILGTAAGIQAAPTTLSETNPWSVGVQSRVNETSVTPGTGGKIMKMDGEFWTQHQHLNELSVGWLVATCFTEEPCFATRSLLPSSVTKNSGQTMKIQYDITFT